MTRTGSKRKKKTGPRRAALVMLPAALAAIAALALGWRLVQPYCRGAFSLPGLLEDLIVLAVALGALRLLLLAKPGWTAASASAAALLVVLIVYAAALAPRAGLVAMIGLTGLFAAALFCAAAAGGGPGPLLIAAILLAAVFPLAAGAPLKAEEPLSFAFLLFSAALVKPGLNKKRRWTLYVLPMCLLPAVWLSAAAFVPAALVALVTLAAGVRLKRGALCLSGAAALALAIAGRFLSGRFAPFAAYAASRLHAAGAAWMAAYAAHALRFLACAALLSLLTRFKRVDEGDVAPLLAGLVLGALLKLTGAEAAPVALPFLVPAAADGAAHLFSKR